MVDEIKIGVTQVYHTAAVTLGAALIAVGFLFFAPEINQQWQGFWIAIFGIGLIVIPSFLAERKIKQARN